MIQFPQDLIAFGLLLPGRVWLHVSSGTCASNSNASRCQGCLPLGHRPAPWSHLHEDLQGQCLVAKQLLQLQALLDATQLASGRWHMRQMARVLPELKTT